MGKKLREYNQADMRFIDNTTKEFSLSYPDDLDDALNRLEESLSHQQEKSVTPLEFILRSLEKEAWKIADSYGYPRNIKKLYDVFKGYDIYMNPDVISSNAIRVIFYCDHVRGDIENNNLEAIAIDMMKLIFAAIAMNLHDEIIRSNRQVAGSKSKKPPRSCPGIKKAIEKALDELAIKPSNQKTSIKLWKYFKKYTIDNIYEIAGYEIYFEIDRGEDRLIEIDKNNNKKSIKFGAFEKYVNKIKKN